MFAFIIVISAVWCVSTYFEYKQQEDECSSLYAETNNENTNNDNTHTTRRGLNYLDTSDRATVIPRTTREFERYDVAHEDFYEDQLSTILYSPPPYNQINYLVTGESTTNMSSTRYKY